MHDTLKGIYVVDLTTMPPWALATLLLTELGAKVVKIESPLGGDYTRVISPQINGKSVLHAWLNRGKKSIVINLKKPEGREIVRRMIERADVLVEAFSPETAQKLGIDYKVFKAINPKLIHCSITAFGTVLPRAGHDINILAMTGALSLTRDKDGRPILPGVLIADFSTAILAVTMILASLLKKQQTGLGGHIDLSMYCSTIPFLVPALAHQVAYMEQPDSETHFLMGASASYNTYKTKDQKYLALGIAVEHHMWEKLCTLIGRLDLVEKQFRKEARDELAKLFATKTREEWLNMLKEGECVSPVLSIAEAVDSPIGRVNFFQNSTQGKRFLKTPFSVMEGFDLKEPELGEHTREVLLEVGYTLQELAVLKEAGVVQW